MQLSVGDIATLHRDTVPMADHPVVGEYRSIDPGMIMSETSVTVRRPAHRRANHGADRGAFRSIERRER